MENWEYELKKIEEFSSFLDKMPSLPLLPEQEMEDYTQKVIDIQNMLSLISSLNIDKQPDLEKWDDVVSPLWRKLFLKGDDIDRYTFSHLWLMALLNGNAGEKSVFRTATGFIASCRNFSLFDEGIEVGKEILKKYSDVKSASKAHFLNTLGSLHYCKKNWDEALSLFSIAKAMGESLEEEELKIWPKISKEDFIAQEIINIAETYIEREVSSSSGEKGKIIEKVSQLIDELDKRNLSLGLKGYSLITKCEFAIFKEDFNLARKYLKEIEEFSRTSQGPYYFSIATTHARLNAKLNYILGDYKNAYNWIRKALRYVSVKTYPCEDIFVLEDAIKIVRKIFENKKVYDTEIVKDLVLLLEDKDWYTGGYHSRQVAELCLKIGYTLKNQEALNISILDLEMAGLVHDIGKLKIPWSLLNKIAPITPKEREILKLHSKFGKEILEEIGLIEISKTVYQHHETIDRRGYPLGLIPSLEASIVGICDIFDASTTSNRRYKVSKSIKEAIDELQSLSGVKYNPISVKGIKMVAENFLLKKV